MTFSINFDWSENYDNENGCERFDLSCPNTEHHSKYGHGWETAYEATEDLEGNKCKPYQGCPVCEDDSGFVAPMMNYIYPLDYQGLVTEEIQIKIGMETNCVLVRENSTDDYFLTLTGGGMDLSPSIAYAFYLAQKWLPVDLLKELDAGLCKDSLDKKQFKVLRRVIREQLKNEASRLKEKSKKWNKSIKEISQ